MSGGLSTKVAGVAMMALGLPLFFALGGADESLGGILGVLVMMAGLFVYFRGRQQAAHARATGAASPLHDDAPDVLYLRTFTADVARTSQIMMSGFTTEEEQLSAVVQPFGDMIAIGRPGESLPVPGATRMYVDDANWQTVVAERIQTAPLVIIRAGVGEGLLWEIGQAVTTLAPQRLVVFVFNLSRKDYDTFRARVRAATGLELPAIGPPRLAQTFVDIRENRWSVARGFIQFNDQWQPQFLPIAPTLIRMGFNDYRQPFAEALRPVFERNGVEWRPATRF